MVYQINAKNKRRYFYKFILIILVVDIVLVLFFGNDFFLDTGKILILSMGVLGFTLTFYLIPLLILFLNYVSKNKDSTFRVLKNHFYYTDNNIKKEFRTEDVASIEMILSLTLYENRMTWFFWDEYFYYKIHLKSGSEIILTCLIIDDLKKHFSYHKIKRIGRFFPIIS